MGEAGQSRRLVRRLLIAAAVIAGVAFVGWLDNVTGLRPDVTVLYLIPIGVATYEFGLWPGLVVALATAVVEILAHPAGAGFSEGVIIADAITHLAVFVLAAVVVDRLLVQLLEIRRLEQRRDFDLAVARDVYETTLSYPEISRPDLAVGFRQSFAFELGGDYSYVTETPDGLFVCIGDISGKGVAAALFTVTLHQGVQRILSLTTDPADLVRRLNRRLFAITPGQMFVTLFCALIDGGDLRFVNAGHEPGFLLRPGDKPRPLLSEHTLPLGVNAEVEAEEQRFPFPPGSQLLTYTDGITDSPRMQPDAYRRLAALLADEGDVPAQDLADDVFSAAVPPKGVPQRDDITVLTLRRL